MLNLRQVFISAILLCALSWSSVQAQVSSRPTLAGANIIGAVSQMSPSWPAIASTGQQFEQPLSPTVALSYYDSALPSSDWYGGGFYNPYTILELGERITLSSVSGFVDSISVTLDSINTDSIGIALYPDTLYNTGTDYYHLINIFDGNIAPYWFQGIQSTQVHGRTRLTLPVPHVTVPQNFFIVMIPHISSAGKVLNFFFWAADVDTPHTRTPANSRSAWVGAAGGNIYSAILDGTFFSTSGASLYSNFYTTAYVEEGSQSVAKEVSANDLKVFPNPASGSTEVTLNSIASTKSLLVTDYLGRTVLDLSGTAERQDRLKIATSALPNGVYQIILRDA